MTGAKGTRPFPLSWGSENEALDDVVDRQERPETEHITMQDGAPSQTGARANSRRSRTDRGARRSYIS
jgi:hypothetical protein